MRRFVLAIGLAILGCRAKTRAENVAPAPERVDVATPVDLEIPLRASDVCQRSERRLFVQRGDELIEIGAAGLTRTTTIAGLSANTGWGVFGGLVMFMLPADGRHDHPRLVFVPRAGGERFEGPLFSESPSLRSHERAALIELPSLFWDGKSVAASRTGSIEVYRADAGAGNGVPALLHPTFEAVGADAAGTYFVDVFAHPVGGGSVRAAPGVAPEPTDGASAPLRLYVARPGAGGAEITRLADLPTVPFGEALRLAVGEEEVFIASKKELIAVAKSGGAARQVATFEEEVTDLFVEGGAPYVVGERAIFAVEPAPAAVVKSAVPIRGATLLPTGGFAWCTPSRAIVRAARPRARAPGQ
jgi:hypothetical protein